MNTRTRTIVAIGCWVGPLLLGIVGASMIAGGPREAARDLARGSAREPIRGDRDRLQGEWIATSVERDGLPIHAGREARQSRISFERDEVTLRDGDVSVRGTFSLAPTSNPKAIDLVVPERGADSSRAAGIYSLEDVELRVCFAFPSGERPRLFATWKGSGLTLFAYRRAGIEDLAAGKPYAGSVASGPVLATSLPSRSDLHGIRPRTEKLPDLKPGTPR